jgi:hypothetical protein
MSLRKSPTRTPALLAANRANAHKSTGPRTLEGKRRVGLNALRHGLHAPNALTALAKSSHALREFNGLYLALYAALLPDTTDERAMDLLKRTVLHVWAMKQELTRWAASRAEREAWFGETGGVFPRPEQLLIKRPGWRVRVSLWVRRGRGRGRRRLLQTGAGWEEGRARLHVGVTVTASIGHPQLGCAGFEEVPEGSAPRVVFTTKPESVRKNSGYKNVIPIKDLAAVSPKRRAWERQRTLPAVQGSLRPGLLPISSAEYPVFRHIGSVTGDLVTSLRPGNAALSGPRRSESDDMQSWIERFMTGWEKQHGPIPKKELLPHEI